MSKDKYKVSNWREYNCGLKQRGAITIWISTQMLELWLYQGKAEKGGQYVYSDKAIEVCLVVRMVYHLPLRQTQGFIESFFEQMHLPLPAPCYTQICRRSKTLSVNIRTGNKKAITDIVVDSTGLKVYGEGEWKVRMHGWGKHRTWMKMAVGVDTESQQALAVALTTNAVDDAQKVGDLLEQVDDTVRCFTGDGAYDKDKVRKCLQQRAEQQQEDILEVIAPQHNAVPDTKGRQYMKQRDDDIAHIKALSRAEWKILSGYHQRSKAETFMFRYKVILGGSLRARKFNQQETEVKVGCKILNIMLNVAKPQSERVA